MCRQYPARPCEDANRRLHVSTRGQSLSASKVRTERLRNTYRAISLLVILQDHDNGSGHSAKRAVQGGDWCRSRVEPSPDVEPSRLEIGAIGRRSDLPITILSRQPAVAVILARSA